MNEQKQCERWLIVTYRPNSLFSLRMSSSTSSGGKTLFVPTPWAFKIALVDASFRVQGKELALKVFDLFKGRNIRFNPPEHLVVNNTFIKIKREPKVKKPEEPYISSIAFREFCYYKGDLNIAVDIKDLSSEKITMISSVLAHINYLGKRGSFFQFVGIEVINELPQGFTIPETAFDDSFNPTQYGVVQFLDDIGEIGAKDLFERINTYSGKKVELGKHRVFKPHFLPYKMVSSSKGYSYYRNNYNRRGFVRT